MARKRIRQPKKVSPYKMINDPREPKRITIKVNGKTIKVKQKQSHDKGRFDTEMREGYLGLIRNGFTNKDAAAACGCGTRYFQRRRKQDPAFEELYQEARADCDDIIRAEVHKRGVKGVKTAVYHDGKVVGHKQVYSDNLLMFLAKSRMPSEFGDRQTVDHVHKFDGAAESLVDKLSMMLKLPPPEEPDMIDITPDEVYDAAD